MFMDISGINEQITQEDSPLVHWHQIVCVLCALFHCAIEALPHPLFRICVKFQFCWKTQVHGQCAVRGWSKCFTLNWQVTALQQMLPEAPHTETDTWTLNFYASTSKYQYVFLKFQVNLYSVCCDKLQCIMLDVMCYLNIQPCKCWALKHICFFLCHE